MKLRLTCLAVVTTLLMGCNASVAKDETVAAEVRAMLATQIADWNRGDVDAFMQSYWASPEVRFASGGGVKRGWQPVLDNYKVRYPDASAMGALKTTELEITELSPTAAMAFGNWVVTAGGEDFCGLFTLIIRKIDDRWVIIHDHTSASADTDAQSRSCSEIKALD